MRPAFLLRMHPLLLLATIELVSVHLLSTAPQHPDLATPDAKHVRQDQTVRLVVAIEAEIDGRRSLFADVARVDRGDGARTATPWPAGVPLTVDWFKVEPTAPWVDNEKGGFHWEEIPYAETPWPADPPVAMSRDADPTGTVLSGAKGLGTMAYRVAVSAGNRTLATPGREARYRGGLSPAVHRVFVRRDDTFLGQLTALFHTPYVWASAGDGPKHQAERGIGADCADFIAYGLRRTGRNIEYGSTYDVPAWGGNEPIASAATRGSDGRFLDAKGLPVPVGEAGVRPGDLLLFRRHVAALVEDRAPRGWLDANDVLIHTAWAPPAEESFAESARWTSPPFTVWRVADAPAD